MEENTQEKKAERQRLMRLSEKTRLSSKKPFGLYCVRMLFYMRIIHISPVCALPSW